MSNADTAAAGNGLYDDLVRILGYDRVSNREWDRRFYATDIYGGGAIPNLVIRPAAAAELAEAIRTVTAAGLSVVGVSFTNIAIVAGALSLGIGFGLQNIVNNFVSGIILLLERPIRTGDWISTGSTEGFVKKISVRSTEVQTFNRADVIVPNSELISAPVTNWTLRNRHGRVIVPVGVAYGSDTELVGRLLEEAAAEVPEVVRDQPDLPVRVFFRSFGDSALDFELRCYILDIWYILDVTSRLHFAIDRKFREHGIEIAFPQRDIHIRSGSPPPGGTDDT